jgi:hypothetical protein
MVCANIGSTILWIVQMLAIDIDNLNNHQYLFYNHQTKMINEYNNPTLISCVFPSWFLFGIGVIEMTNRSVEVSFQLHIQHPMNVNDTKYVFSKHHLFPFLYSI